MKTHDTSMAITASINLHISAIDVDFKPLFPNPAVFVHQLLPLTESHFHSHGSDLSYIMSQSSIQFLLIYYRISKLVIY